MKLLSIFSLLFLLFSNTSFSSSLSGKDLLDESHTGKFIASVFFKIESDDIKQNLDINVFMDGGSTKEACLKISEGIKESFTKGNNKWHYKENLCSDGKDLTNKMREVLSGSTRVGYTTLLTKTHNEIPIGIQFMTSSKALPLCFQISKTLNGRCLASNKEFNEAKKISRKEFISTLQTNMPNQICKSDQKCKDKVTKILKRCIKKFDKQILEQIQHPEEAQGIGIMIGSCYDDLTGKEISKSLFVDSMKTTLPNLFCSAHQYFRKCFKVSEDDCIKESIKATKVCLMSMDREIPNILHQPNDGQKWGSKIGECVGNNYELTHRNEKINSSYCNDPSKWK